jgi:acetolactate synthase, small subunit
MRGIFSVLVENKAGVLSQISGLFARRGFNIDSLAVGETENPEISNMTIVSTGDERTVDQVEKNLNKKLDVIKVRRLEESESICLEMLLIKVAYTSKTRRDIMDICAVNGANIIYMSAKNMIIELHETSDKIVNFIDFMRSFGIQEVQRTGTVAVTKG